MKHILIVDDDYLKEHLQLFQNPPKSIVSKSIIEDDLFKDDDLHIKLVKAKQKAEKELRDYEYNKRYNT